VLITEELARIDARLKEKRAQLSDLETHGGLPVIEPRAWFADDPRPAPPMAYEQLSKPELQARITSLRTEVEELGAEKAKLERDLKRKLAAGRRRPRRKPQSGINRASESAEQVPVFRVIEDDYSLVEYKGQAIPLGRMARKAVKVLHEQKGKPMLEARILETIHSESDHLHQLFKRDPARLLWGTLIKHAKDQPGRYYLDLS
jgi:hypothetical protein